MKTQKDKLELELIETIKLHQELIRTREDLEEHLFKSPKKDYVKRIHFLRAMIAIDTIVEMIKHEILNEAVWNYSEGQNN